MYSNKIKLVNRRYTLAFQCACLLAVLDDSIEADSIAKSDDTLESRSDVTTSALDKAQAEGKASTDAITDRQGVLQQQKDAVAKSLEHVQDNAVTASKITDPEQEFQLGESC